MADKTTLTTEDAARIARLARLAPSQEKLETFAGQLGDILAYMDVLAEVDVSDTAPLYSPVERETPFREDEAVRRRAREEILANAPETDGAFFITPKIV